MDHLPGVDRRSDYDRCVDTRSEACIRLRGRGIGTGSRCFVVAEAGVNHNGDRELAKRLVEAAADAGADAVKFQTWSTNELVTLEAPLAAYQAENLGNRTSQHEMLKKLELRRADLAAVKAHADTRGILFFSAADDEGSADLLDELGVEVIKIGSGELTNLPLLAHVAAKKKPVVLSTGMADMREVATAVATLEEAGCRSLVLLHCVSLYPAEPGDANLRAMDALAGAFGYPVGFSDHTLGDAVALAAVARGACMLEKHLTLDVSMDGPDHRMSLDPQAFRSLVASVRLVEQALGDGRKRPVSAELETRKAVRRVVVAARALPAGHVLKKADLALRRAGPGLPPAAIELVTGRRLRVDLAAGAPVELEAIA